MRTDITPAAVFMLAWGVLVTPEGPASAGSRSGGSYSIVADSLDGGGQRAASAAYVNDACLGGIVGVSSDGAPVQILRAGYAGQLTDVTRLTVAATPTTLNEGQTGQLSGVATMDDDTTTMLAPGDVQWSPATFPLLAITPAGVVSPATVYADTAGAVTGTYSGVEGAAALVVRNTNPDDYGIYAGDQVADEWQVRYFGESNPAGLGSALGSNGLVNLENYIADLDPTDPRSGFFLKAISGPEPSRVYFTPSSTGRVYTLQWRASPMTGAWADVTGQVRQPGGAGPLSDATATGAQRFYRVSVSLP